MPSESLFRPWVAITLDLIVELPVSAGHTVVLAVVDQLTKMAHFTPFVHLPSAEEMTQLLVIHVICLHGLPEWITFN